MAFASPAANYKTDESLKNVNIDTSDSKKTPSLDFYESMYHFKKMFPKFDSDVIEQILRANSGAVDKTIDQLLTMSADYDSFEHEKKIVNIVDTNTNNNHLSHSTMTDNYSYDLPPSYNEFMSSQSQTQGSVITDSIKDSTTDDVQKKYSEHFKSLVDDSISDKVANELKLDGPTESRLIIGSMFPCISSQVGSSSNVRRANRSNIMIGELSRDFLRIKLNTEQVKKMKVTIKKAKRGELTDIINEKAPEIPEEKPISLEMKTQLAMLREPENNPPVIDEPGVWQSGYQIESKKSEKERIQIIQDEYLAKVIQDEEFLNELRHNKEFMETLNADQISSDRNEFSSIVGWKSSENRKNYSISNTELKNKLVRMSNKTRLKFIKLATQFTKKARQKCNKTAEQVAVTCNNMFTTYNSIEYYHGNHKTHKDNEDGLEKANNPSRAQKAYKSFKTVIRKNQKRPDVLSDQEINIFDDTDTKFNGASIAMSQFKDYGYDHPASQPLPRIENFNMKFDKCGVENANSSVIHSYKPLDLDLFSNDYSYDNNAENKKEFTYDYSVYPPVKILNHGSNKSKVPENFRTNEKTYK